MKKINKGNFANELVFLFCVFSMTGLLVLSAGCQPIVEITGGGDLQKFKSNAELLNAFKSAQGSGRSYGYSGLMKAGVAVLEASVATTGAAAPTATAGAAADSGTTASSYSKTNIQVEGVDEADIVKSDGKYIYYVNSGRLVIAKAYPAETAEILTEQKLSSSDSEGGYFNAQEIFIDGDKLMIFGSSNVRMPYEEPTPMPAGDTNIANAKIAIMPPRYGWYRSSTTVKIFDISDKSNPKVIKTYDFDGAYMSSRKIGSDVYFVMRSYPDYRILADANEAFKDLNETSEDVKCIAPLYREDTGDFQNIAKCTEIAYIPPIEAQNFITVVSLSINNDRELQKEVIVGNGQEIYASMNNLYIVSPSFNSRIMPLRAGALGEQVGAATGSTNENTESTKINKFSLDSGKVKYVGSGNVPGHILNQFSMDEYDGKFRIATTISGYVYTNEGGRDTSTNNMYVLDENVNLIGKLEGIAPGESIYSVRFMGKRAYMVTFKHVDPLFVIDLSQPTNPTVLGKLKIPGYSDYLHPYDETHLIGIGKEVDESIDADKVHTEGAVYYTAIQGVKISIFDVSDVSNPVEMYKEVIGDRGTESLATSEHKAFLFDREKELLVVPMTVAERKPGQDKSQEGEFTFQGAYVYKINLREGLKLKGRVSHIDDQSEYLKAGYYFRSNGQIVRSLYMDNALYTLSNMRIQANSLLDLSMIKALNLTTESSSNMGVIY